MTQGKAASENGVDVFDKEIIILEITDQADIEQDPEDQQQPARLRAGFLNPQCDPVVDGDRRDDQDQVTRIVVSIEEERGGDQEQPLVYAVLQAGKGIINGENDRQEGEDKNIRRKDHPVISPGTLESAAAVRPRC